MLQGVAEWLPISSEGLVTLTSKLLFGRVFETALASAVWLHVGTLFSAIIYLRRDIAKILEGFLEEGPNRRLLLFLTAATLFSTITALPALFFLRGLAFSDAGFTASVGLFLIMTGFLPRKATKFGKIETFRNGLMVGLVQGLSVIPGISRSGVTISALIMLGAPIHEAFKLSYLMSIPVTAGAQILLPLMLGVSYVSAEMLAGAAAAFIVGLMVMKALLSASANINPKKLMVPLGAVILFLGVLMAFQ